MKGKETRQGSPEPDRAEGRDLQPPLDADFRETAEAERLQRLLADLDMLNTVRAAGFRGPLYDELVKALVEYGYQVIGSWIRTGAVYRKLAEKGKAHYLARFPRRVPPRNDADEITNDVVADAIVAYVRDVLMPGRWDFRGGASLATFFIGQCLLRYPRVYIEWLKATKHNDQCVVTDEIPLDLSRRPRLYDDPAQVAFVRSELREAGYLAPKKTLEIVLLIEEGYSHLEIAHMLDISVGAIESRLYRHQKACERRHLDDIA